MGRPSTTNSTTNFGAGALLAEVTLFLEVLHALSVVAATAKQAEITNLRVKRIENPKTVAANLL